MITHSSVNIRQTNQSKEHQKNSDQKQKITEAFDPRLNTKIPTLSPHSTHGGSCPNLDLMKKGLRPDRGPG